MYNLTLQIEGYKEKRGANKHPDTAQPFSFVSENTTF